MTKKEPAAPAKSKGSTGEPYPDIVMSRAVMSGSARYRKITAGKAAKS